MENVVVATSGAGSLVDLMTKLQPNTDDDKNEILPSEILAKNVVLDDYGPVIAAITTVEDPTHQIRIIKYLVSKRMADLKAHDKTGRNALMIASMLGYKNTVCLLLDEYEMDPFCQDVYGQTCLMLACENGYENVVKLLLDHVNHSGGREKLIKFLDTQNKHGETPFSLALKHGQLDCANVLSEYHKRASEVEKSSNETEKSTTTTTMANNGQFEIKFPLRLEIPSGKEFRRPTTSSSASSSLVSTDRSSVPDLTKLTDYLGDERRKSAETIHSSLSYTDLNSHQFTTTKLHQAAPAANISIQVAVNFSAPSHQATTDEDVPMPRLHSPGPVVRNMIREKQNVKRHNKVRRLFHVDSGGSPASTDNDYMPSSPEIMASPNLTDRVKRLLDRRLQYAALHCNSGRFSYDPVNKSESSSEGDCMEECKNALKKCPSASFKPRRSKSSNSSKGGSNAVKDKLRLPPIKGQLKNSKKE